MYCKNCGKKLHEGSTVCLNCGGKSTPISNSDPNAMNKEVPSKVRETRQGNGPSPIGTTGTKSKYGWVIGIIIIIAFGVWGYLGDNESDTFTNNSLTSVGDYYCSDYHAEQADLLLPNVDYTNDIVALDALWYEIENMVVDETNQVSVDEYNAKLDEYEEKAADLDKRIVATEGSIEEHDRKVQAYNDYLEDNCEY